MYSVIKQKNPEWLYVYYIKQISGQEVWLEMKKIKEVILGRLAAPSQRTSQKRRQLEEDSQSMGRARGLVTLSLLTDELSFQSTQKNRKY